MNVAGYRVIHRGRLTTNAICETLTESELFVSEKQRKSMLLLCIQYGILQYEIISPLFAVNTH